MSSQFYDRFDTKTNTKNKESEIYVSGIPVELEKEGLANIFCKAGQIESVRIIPPKNLSHTTTFGFITYKNKTAAATAIESFNNFKLGAQSFRVRFSDNNQSASTSSAFMTPTQSNSKLNENELTPRSISASNKSMDVSVISESVLLEQNIVTLDELNKRKSMGRGLMHVNNQIKTSNRPLFDVSRPYARRLHSARSISSVPNDNEVKLVAEPVKKETLIINKIYPISITHVNTPDNFFIQLTSSLSNKANLINNLDNHYRNNLSEDKSDEFSNVETSAIRCKLHNVEPFHCREWSTTSIELLISLQKTIVKDEGNTERLEAKVYACENFKSKNGRDEIIYSVDLLFGGEDSVIEYMVDNEIAIFKDNIESKLEPKPLVSPLKPPVIIQPTKCDLIKVVKNQIYTVNVQYFDNTFSDQFFYVTLSANAAKLDELDTRMQLNTSSNKLKYITAINELKEDDFLEALFEDQKWYRVRVQNMQADCLDVYFLDYGNTQTFTHSDIVKNQLLRKRIYYEDKVEAQLYGLDYQAIKCFYVKDKKLSIEAFIEKLATMSNIDSGVDILVVDYETDAHLIQFFDITTPTTPAPKETYDEDDEVFNTSDILIQNIKCSVLTIPDNEINLNLDIDTKHNACISHIISSNEFYVQLEAHLKLLIDHQLKIQTLAGLSVPMQFKSIKGQPAHQLGDICLAKYLCDTTWYKGVIVKVQPDETDYTYDVFFTDYGNVEYNMPDHLISSIQTIKNAIKMQKKPSLEADLKSVVEFPFQAICCKLYKRKESIRNTQILKTLMNDCFNFNIRIKEPFKQMLTEQICIKKYAVNLYSEEKLLDEQFESIVSEVKAFIPLNVLEDMSVHEFRLAHFGSETELFVNLTNQITSLEQLQAEINADVETINKSTTDNKFKLGDLVLAKFYNEDKTFDWYRARILSIDSNVYEVFYIDYGNTDKTLTVNDIRLLPIKYTKQAQFAYNIRMNGISALNLDQHQAILSDYLLGEGYKFKVVSKRDDYYLVELWNQDLLQCLNKIIEQTYSIVKDMKPIETCTLNDLFKTNKRGDFKVKTKYMFVEDFKRPFYFSLEQDTTQRDFLISEMNSFYSQKSDKFTPSLNDYCAVISENSWYRAQIKAIEDDKYQLFYIDYGYDELMDNLDRIRRLDDKFLDQPRFVFGAYLLKTSSQERIELVESDEVDLAPTLEAFFTGDDELELLIKTKSTELNHFNSEFYFGVEIFNKNNANLNQMIIDAKQEISVKKHIKLKPKLPGYIRLQINALPQQTKTKQLSIKDNFRMFTKQIDLFYIFNEEKALNLQLKVQQICLDILEEKKEFESVEETDHTRLPAKGDLVYGKFEDDQAWYRCLITNCNQNRNKYELFYFDFGNIDVRSRDDILYGWKEEHFSLFKEIEPLAYKCKLYGLKPHADSKFSNEQNLAFKEITADKLFNAKFVKFNIDEDIYEIYLSETNLDWFQMHSYLLKNKLADLSVGNLYESLQLMKFQDEIEFFSQLVDLFHKTERQFS